MPDVKFFCLWDDSEILQTQDADLIQRSHEYKDEIFEEWTQFSECMAKYPDVFQQSIMVPELFFKLWAQVCTRNFYYGLPCTTMIPMADNFNHSDGEVQKEIIHRDMHLIADRTS